MGEVTSSDGTVIAYETRGSGPAVVLVDGALCSRTMGPSTKLAEQLADRFTVYTYDRRGRGESGDAGEYSVEREIDDLRAVIDAAGGSASVWGASSGAALALEAAARGVPIEKLALYEAPFIVDGTRDPLPADYLARLEGHLAAGRRGDAVAQFLRVVGMPRAFLAVMRRTPIWRKLKAMAHTLPYDTRVVAAYQRGEPLPEGRWSGARMPAVVHAGGKSPAWMKNGARALAAALPNADYRELAKQTHMVKPKVLAPELAGFFGGRDGGDRDGAHAEAAVGSGA